MPATMASPTVILVSGFARAGKDTLAEGIIDGATSCCRSDSFAHALKAAADNYLNDLDLLDYSSGQSFTDEHFKAANRDILVTLGRFARSLDQDVFARVTAHKAAHCNAHTVIPDWRYLNEYRVMHAYAEQHDLRLVTVRVDTAGIGPANEEELQSLAAIRRAMPCDFEFTFAPDSRRVILAEGKHLAQMLGL